MSKVAMNPTERVKHFGLSCAAPVKWLIGREPDLHRAIQAFAEDRADRDVIKFAGPPSDEDMLKIRENANFNAILPTVTFTLRKVTHHLTGEQGIEVKCSDADLAEIVRWHRQARMNFALAVSAERTAMHT